MASGGRCFAPPLMSIERRVVMNRATAGGAAFLAVGVAFIAIGSSGQRAFIPIGAAFVFIGVMFIVRRRRSGGLR
jgi:hypothetical protein